MQNSRSPNARPSPGQSVIEPLWIPADTNDAANITSQPAVVLTSALFFASGFAALTYQIAWQRALFGYRKECLRPEFSASSMIHHGGRI